MELGGRAPKDSKFQRIKNETKQQQKLNKSSERRFEIHLLCLTVIPITNTQQINLPPSSYTCHQAWVGWISKPIIPSQLLTTVGLWRQQSHYLHIIHCESFRIHQIFAYLWSPRHCYLNLLCHKIKKKYIRNREEEEMTMVGKM